MATQNCHVVTTVNGDDAAAQIRDRAVSTVLETVARCYRILDGTSGNLQDGGLTVMRYAGYTQTLALLLGVETREVDRLLRARAL